MAETIGVPLTQQILDAKSPNIDLWFKSVTNRLNIYTGSSDPTASNIPQGQWFLYRNTSTNLTKLWSNYNGVVYSITLDGTVFAPSTSGSSILYGNGSGGFSNVTVGSGLTFAGGTLSAAGGSGTVTSFTFTNANGITGTVTNSTTTPTLSLSLGAITPTSVAATDAITSTGGGIGYATGAGGTVTQLTSKSTAVTLNKLSGQITMSAALLANGRVVSFTLNNTFIAAGDVISVGHTSGGTVGVYICSGAGTGTGTGQINIANLSGSGLSEAVVLTFAVIKSVSS